MLKNITNLAGGKWEVNAFLIFCLLVLVTGEHFPLLQHLGTALPACLTQKKSHLQPLLWELGVVLAHCSLPGKPNAEDQAWSANENHSYEASKRTLCGTFANAPRSTYLPKEIQLSLPVFTRRGVGDFEGEKAQPSQPSPFCELKSAGAHWVEQLREAPRANFGLRPDQSYSDDTQKAQVTESLWERSRVKPQIPSYHVSLRPVVALGTGLPPTLRAQADSHRPHLLRQRTSSVESRSQAGPSNKFYLGRRLPALPSGWGGTCWSPPLGLQASLQRPAVSASLHAALSAFVQDTTFGSTQQTADYRQSCLTGSG